MDRNVDNGIEDVIISSVVFSADRENASRGEGDGEMWSGGVDPFRVYLRDIGREDLLSRAQEFRVALMVEACKLLAEDWDTITKAWGRRHIWEEVYHQFCQAWQNAQEECLERGFPLPVLPNILAEASNLPQSLRDQTPLYVQEYLTALGWGKGRRKESDGVEENTEVEKIARDLCMVMEGTAVLPPTLQQLLRNAVEVGEEFPSPGAIVQHLDGLGATGKLQFHEQWIADRGIAARELLGIANTRFAVTMAKKFRQEGEDLQDLVGEANCALIRAVRNFQPYRGTRFCTLAGTFIGNALRTRMQVERKNPITRARSIHEPVGQMGEDGEEILLGDMLAARVEDPLDAAYQLMLHELLQEVLKTLPERERRIIVLRHGFEGEPPYTLEQIGEIFDVTRERIRQLEVEGEVKIIRQIARRFPDVLPTGMTPELAILIAEERLSHKKLL